MLSDADVMNAIEDAMGDTPGYETWCGGVHFTDTALFLTNLRALGYEIVKKEPTDVE